MKKKALVFILALFLLTTWGSIYIVGASIDSEYINVRLTNPIKNKVSINIYSRDGFAIYNKDNLSRKVRELDTNFLNIGLHGGEIVLSYGDQDFFNLSNGDNLLIGSANDSNSIVKVEDNTYRGYLSLKTNGRELILINYISLEEYLYGVVPREMPASFNMDALKAQAIASRTYTLYNINKHRGEGFNLCDTTHCQVYGGMEGEHERTSRAVEETYGLVAQYNGQIIDSVYHSNSGGRTRDSEEVWGGYLPYLRGVDDPFSEGVTSSTWSFSISANDLYQRLRNNGINIGMPLNMEVVERTVSGRVKTIKIVGEYGEKILSESMYKQVLGAGNFRTTWFSILGDGASTVSWEYYTLDASGSSKLTSIKDSYVIDGSLNNSLLNHGKISVMDQDGVTTLDMEEVFRVDKFIISGKGFGHGVGMSQWGANTMGNKGYDFSSILKHYYTGVEINKIY